MTEEGYFNWMATRTAVKSDDRRWPYLKWRYENETRKQVLADIWAFPDSWLAWADMQANQGLRPWHRREENPNHRKRVLQELRDKGLLPQVEPNATQAA